MPNPNGARPSNPNQELPDPSQILEEMMGETGARRIARKKELETLFAEGSFLLASGVGSQLCALLESQPKREQIYLGSLGDKSLVILPDRKLALVWYDPYERNGSYVHDVLEQPKDYKPMLGLPKETLGHMFEEGHLHAAGLIGWDPSKGFWDEGLRRLTSQDGYLNQQIAFELRYAGFQPVNRISEGGSESGCLGTLQGGIHVKFRDASEVVLTAERFADHYSIVTSNPHHIGRPLGSNYDAHIRAGTIVCDEISDPSRGGMASRFTASSRNAMKAVVGEIVGVNGSKVLPKNEKCY